MFENDAPGSPYGGAGEPYPTFPAAPPEIAVATPPQPTQQSGERPRSRTRLLIVLAIVGALLVVGGGGAAGVFALVQYSQPGATASQFCQDLKAQNFDSAYATLSPALRDRYTSGQFHQLNETLDTIEGKVTACGSASGSGAYNYTLGGSTATVGAVLTREKQGKLQGSLHLVSDNGWKVDAIDTALLGVNPGALQTLGTFCTALQAQDYNTVYGLLGSNLRGQSSQEEYGLLATLDDLLDGKVTSCTILALAKGNTDTATTATVSVTRSIRGASSGSISLESSGGAWTIVKMDAGIQGRDLQPLLTGTGFCLDIVIGDFAGAYALGSAAFQQATTQAQLMRKFALPAGDKWVICAPDMTTYQVSASAAQYSGTFEYTNASNAFLSVAIAFSFTKEQGQWKIASVTLGGS